VAHPPGGARRLSIALSAAVALALILGTAYVSLVTAGVPVLPAPLNLVLFLAVATAIVVLSDRLRSNMILDEITVLRRDLDERDGRIYAALARQRAADITDELPRPRTRAVVTMPLLPGPSAAVVELPSPSTVEAMRRLARKVTDA
jgi:hypothetical protein